MEPITRKEMFLAKAAGQDVTTPEPITREEKFLAKIAENGGGVSSWNDLTDKPFGESENAVLLPPTQFAYDSTFGLFAVPGYIDFVVGKTYTVNWNGVDYTTVGVPGQFNGESLVMIGNPAALGGANNNLPFAIACLMGSIGAIPLDGSTAVNVGISGYWFAKVPEKFIPTKRYDIYLPDDIIKQTDNGTLEASMDYDTTELVDAILAGRDIFIQLNHGSYPIRIYASLVQCAYAGDTLEDAVKAMADKQGKNDVTLIITAYAGMAPLTIIMNWNE